MATKNLYTPMYEVPDYAQWFSQTAKVQPKKLGTLGSPTQAPAVTNPMAAFSMPGTIDPAMAAYAPEYNASIGLDSTNSNTSFLGGVKDWWGGNKDWIIGNKETPGVLPTGLSVGQGILNSYLGLQSLGMAKDSLASQKEQFSKNFGMQQEQIADAYGNRAAAQAARRGETNYANIDAAKQRGYDDTMSKWGKKGLVA